MEQKSDKLLEHIDHPNNRGVLNNPDGQGQVTRVCGDSLLIQVKLEGAVIKQIRFETNGCDYTRACGSMATSLARTKSLKHALSITAEQIDIALGGLPAQHKHCAEMAARALYFAIEDAIKHLKGPLKQAYGALLKQ